MAWGDWHRHRWICTQVYAAELAPPKLRGPLGGLFNVFISAGILAVSDEALAERLDAWRDALSASIPEVPTDE